MAAVLDRSRKRRHGRRTNGPDRRGWGEVGGLVAGWRISRGWKTGDGYFRERAAQGRRRSRPDRDGGVVGLGPRRPQNL